MFAGVDQTSWGHRSFFLPTTWNSADKEAAVTLSNSDLTIACSTPDKGGRGILGIDLDAGESAYVEFTIDTVGSSVLGVGKSTAPISGTNPQGHADSWGYGVANGNWENTGSTSTGVSFSASDIMMMAVKGTKIWWGKNGAWSLSGNPAGDSSPAFSNLSGVIYPLFIQTSSSASIITANFAQNAFSHTPPAGFTAGWGVAS